MAAFTRKGLHRLECATCGETDYRTVPQLERRGLPPCWCGDHYQPATLELAMHLDATDAPVMAAYTAKTSSVAHGQAWNGGSGYEQPEQVAFESVAADLRLAAKRRRLGALGFSVMEVEREVPTKPGAKNPTKIIRDLMVVPTPEAMPF